MKAHLTFLLALGAALGSLTGCSADDTVDASASTGDTSTSGTGTSTDATGSGTSTGTASGTGGGAACDPVETSAMVFDGVDDSVTMGLAPELGLAELTVEAWVHRTGRGKEANTGVGGLSLVPIAGKGRGENDDTTKNCNYAFGFAGDVLGADFEDNIDGGNHPIWGTRPIPYDEWHHVAVTYDGATWRLFVDGELDAESAADATPRADSIQHFGIGAAFDSTGAPAGAFEGAIDEVRVWDHARTEAEIAGARFTALTQGPGLVGRWALDEADGGAIDSVGDLDGTVAGATFFSPGASLDLGAPPVVDGVLPEDDAVVAGASVELEVDLADPDGDAVEVTFHVREIVDEDDFTIVVLPDTQNYTNSAARNKYFYDQTDWIMENRKTFNIVAVIHNGDIVNNEPVISQWTVADKAMTTLETADVDIPDGLPYGVCVGNHDQDPNGTFGSTSNFNTYFGVDRFIGRAYYGGHYGSTNDENWITFNAGGRDFVVVNLQYDQAGDGPAAVNQWARSIFEQHPDAFGIVNSHSIVFPNDAGDAVFSAQGRRIYDTMKDVPNVHLMTNGHHGGRQARRTDTFEGHTIQSMFADYQFDANGGGGYLRIWEMSPKNNELTVRSYSPSEDKYLTGDASEFTLPVDLSGAGGAFQDLATAIGTAKVTATFDGLQPGKTYEWYATLDDCTGPIATSVQRFTTE